jgi:hypothetical protein
MERGLLSRGLVERVELLDEEDFVKLALAADDLIAL